MARILFIDDDIDTLQTYEKVVALYGHQALLAEDASQALHCLKEEPVDLILLDRRLEGVDGFKVLKQIRCLPRAAQIPVVMVSASHEDFARRALAEGAQAYVCKPLFVQDILELIEKYAAA